MKISQNGQAVATLKELHDMVEGMQQFPNLAGNDNIVTKIDITFDANVSTEEQQKVMALAKRLEAALAEISEIGGEFHDMFDGEFC